MFHEQVVQHIIGESGGESKVDRDYVDMVLGCRHLDAKDTAQFVTRLFDALSQVLQ